MAAIVGNGWTHCFNLQCLFLALRFYDTTLVLGRFGTALILVICVLTIARSGTTLFSTTCFDHQERYGRRANLNWKTTFVLQIHSKALDFWKHAPIGIMWICMIIVYMHAVSFLAIWGMDEFGDWLHIESDLPCLSCTQGWLLESS